ncbi:hypothetical protein LTR84_001603 [Exophiala bonariae]|uniref:Survival Motor Neuron Gemin2-binding domain-containing protein n=1 Tax=Exophiala bonariae TaxID=1690606 RepID=A0AAV9ND53_9EURO|nr:hypothetical protein LTR84_001603 [Exophiala bonariae]
MGKNKRQKQNKINAGGGGSASLTQEEIWDDSALIRSWNDALQEYEYYHSIHAKGEDVEEVLRRAETGDFDDPDVGMDACEWRDANGTAEEDYAALMAGRTPPSTSNNVAEEGEVEEGELDDTAEVQQGLDATHTGNRSQLASKTATLPQNTIIGPQLPHAPNGPAAAQSGTAGGASMTPQDQTLENLKMAYYWAGYYSGLYDGQQQTKSQPQS